MRIIAGKHRGRILLSPNDKGIRPTSSMLREALFNVLESMQILENAKIMDICCGTGAYGIEAISRGASLALFIDGSGDHLNLAKQNILTLKEEDKAIFIRSRAENLPKAQMQFDIIFIDPPYFKKVADKALLSLLKQGWLHENSYIVVEQAKIEDLNYSTNDFKEIAKRIYGNSKFILLKKLFIA
jgi:16S rRNA (guanine966-N2)-methyltransferase